MSREHYWIHCEKHNIDYPNVAECPYCKQARILEATDIWDREYTPEPYKPSKLGLNIRLAYWTLRVKLGDLKEALKLYFHESWLRKVLS